MNSFEPFASMMRPKSFIEFVDQNNIVGKNSVIDLIVKSKRLTNLIFWGPPGVGKTTLAKIIGEEFKSNFCSLNATEIGSKILKDLGDDARFKKTLNGTETIVFIDEIHRLNKAQQDILLPFVESGTFVLIGATTENPGYEINKALLSRCHLLVFERISSVGLKKIWNNATKKMKLNEDWISEDCLESIILLADGDARKFLNIIEILALEYEQNKLKGPIHIDRAQAILPQQLVLFDKKGDQHYDVVSALIKSIRGSDPDSALYYLARSIKGGEDPFFIARRLIILASEDIGNADPRAIQIAIAGADAVEKVGLPECAINLSQVVCYLSAAPKSNKVYQAWLKSSEFVEQYKSAPIPLHLRSSQTQIMKSIGHGVDYKYPHNGPKGWVKQDYWPSNTPREIFYEPSERGFEKAINEYMSWLKK